MNTQVRRKGRPALDLIEDAVHLLRAAPLGTLAVYYVGALPFVLAFLYFWSDMSRSAFAEERLEPLAALLALLFFWMKLCQGAFARRLWAQVAGVAAVRTPSRERVASEAGQCCWQATGFIVLPVALLIALPFGWCFAFYQSLTTLGGMAQPGDGSRVRRAWRHAWLWPLQNHALIAILSGTGLVVFLNVIITLVALPFFLRTLFGVESSFTQSIWAMFNTTFLASAAAITWLCLDPLVKATYVLRCFHGEAIASGDDIRAELRALATGPGTAKTMAALAGLLIVLHPAGAAESPQPTLDSPGNLTVESSPGATTPTVAAGELNEAIDEVLQRREFTWRLPREQLAERPAADHWLQRAIDRMFVWLEDTAKSIGRTILEIIRWLLDKLFGRGGPREAGGTGWADAVRGLFILLLIVLAAAIGYLAYRLWKNYQAYRPEVLAQPAPAAPDLTDDSLSAAQLPEDEWLRLAREMIAKGELRLALRAFYLAGLAHLAGRGLLTIARYKSNYEYAVELGRRSHALPAVMSAFTRNVTVFDRVWYGRHEATQEVLNEFESNVQRIRET